MSTVGSASGGGPPSRPDVFDLQGFARRFIPFITMFVSGQKAGARGQYLTANFVNTNTPTTFTIALGHIPDKFIIVGAYVDGTVFASATNRAAWTSTSIVLQTAVAGQYALWVG